VPLAATPTYNATKAAIHSWSQSLRHQLKDTSVKVVEWAPPAVATDLMPGHAENPNSMPLADFTAESLALFEAGNDEVLVERVKFLSGAEGRGEYAKVFGILNGHCTLRDPPYHRCIRRLTKVGSCRRSGPRPPMRGSPPSSERCVGALGGGVKPLVGAVQGRDFF
jgi:hypothetical protein